MPGFFPPGAINNAPAAAGLPFLVKNGLVVSRATVNDSIPNAWHFYADNAAGIARIPYLNPVDASNRTFLDNWYGVGMYGLYVAALPTPAAPTITNNGTAGATTYTYKIVARNGLGQSLGTSPVSAAGSTTTGNATLSATNSNTVTFSSISGAASYDVYRTVGGARKDLSEMFQPQWQTRRYCNPQRTPWSIPG